MTLNIHDFLTEARTLIHKTSFHGVFDNARTSLGEVYKTSNDSWQAKQNAPILTSGR